MKIYAHAMSRSDLGAWIEEHTFPVMCAIAQLYIFPDTEYVNHWRQEVWSKFDRMKLLKSKKLPSSKFIYDNSWAANKFFVQDAMNWAIDHETTLSPQRDNISDLTTIMDSYFQWISSYLSKSRYVRSSDVYEELKLLGL